MRTNNRSLLTTHLFTFSLLVLIVVMVPSDRTALAFSEKNAIAHIQSLGESALETLAQDLPIFKRDAKFAEMLRESFGIPFIARFAMGRSWRSTSEKQRKEYINLFENFVIRSYSKHLTDLNEATFEIEKAEPIGGKQDILVTTIIKQAKGQILKLSWRVRPINGSPKIIDVIAEGISMAITKQSEFASVLRKGGVLGLIIFLRSKLDPRLAAS